MSFIARAKLAKSARVLLGRFQSAGKFDVCLEKAGMTCTHIEDGLAVLSIPVTRNLCNNYDTLHGGAISTIVDVVGTFALLSKDPTRAGVSIEMNQTFCSAARLGDNVLLTGRVLRYGRQLGFTEVTLRRGDENGALVATGRHTKMFVPESETRT